MCPHCQNSTKIIKNGSYWVNTCPKRVQRYRCLSCGKGFSQQTLSFDYRWRKRRINQVIFRMLSKGSSQRACAQVLGVTPPTVARRVVRFGMISQEQLEAQRLRGPRCEEILIDEMESFEHTKLKPVTIPIAVEKKTRKIVAFTVGKIAAKGHLAALAFRKYGLRKCERQKVLSVCLEEVKVCLGGGSKILSDESPHYPRLIKRILPGTIHVRFKGGRGAIVGQGELKKIAFDPLFQLNHTYAMIRDNIKRLTRRTWCTTKVLDRLKNMIAIYANYHNQIVSGVRRPCMSNNPN